MKKKSFHSALMSLFLLVALLAGTARGELLDMGPVVPEVVGSSEPTLGHGFPLWYRDTNRVPLQLCTDRASGMCLTAEPNPGLPLSFPDNMSDELFWWSGEALMTVPAQGDLDRDGDALLVMAIEAAFSTEAAAPGAQVSFARMRIRVDTPYAGEYIVTTPYKVFTFNVAADLVGDGINMTQDIGLAEGGIFTGALKGTIGPFLYCTNAPIVVNGKSFLGNPGADCAVRGSTFPSAENPTNYFRVQGPNGLDIQTDRFAISGMIYDQPIPTPLTVERVSFSRQGGTMLLNAFATTQPLANQTAGGDFPGNFALSGVPSALVVNTGSLAAVSTQTNTPADGRFFGSRLLPDPGTLPATATVTNVSDVPPTVKEVPLVDEVVIDSASYNRANKTLTVSAASYDSVGAPSLSLHIPGMEGALGTLVDGKLSVTFPVTDNTATPPRTFNIPPSEVTVVSAGGGSDTRAVTGVSPFGPAPTGSLAINGGATYTNNRLVTLNLSASSVNGAVTQMRFSHDGSSFFAPEPYAATRSLAFPVGDGSKSIYVKFIDVAGKVSPAYSASIILDTVPPSGSVVINGDAPLTGTAPVQLTLAATDDQALASMQFSNDGTNYFTAVPYATGATLTLFPGDGVRTVSVRFIDAAGNVSVPASDSITASSTPPTGSILINGGATVTRGSSVTLTLSATAAAGSVTHMQFSKDGASYFGFEPYATTRAMALLPAEGPQTIWVRFRDELGNVSAPLSATIIRDTTNPTGSIAFTDADPTSAATGTLELSATDENVVTQMQFSRNGGASYFPPEPFATSKAIPLSLGLNTITVRYRDEAGNVSDPVSASITRN